MANSRKSCCSVCFCRFIQAFRTGQQELLVFSKGRKHHVLVTNRTKEHETYIFCKDAGS